MAQAASTPTGARRKRGLSRGRLILILIAPIEILLFLVVIFPFALEVYLSTTNWQPQFGPWWQGAFVGGQNYVDLFLKDVRYVPSLARTALITGSAISIEFILGLAIAVLFVREFVGKRVLFSVMLLPMMVVPVIVGYAFYMIFLEVGPVNFIIELFTGERFLFGWLAYPHTGLLALIVTDVWHWTPLMFLILFAGLVAVPENPIKAAKVLGASGWRIFWDVKIPMLKPIILLAIAIRAMESLKLFDEIFVMTGGGPGFGTETFSFYTYLSALKYFRLGYSASEAIVMLLITVFLIYFLVRPALRISVR